MREVLRKRLGKVTTFGVISDGSDACQRILSEGGMTLCIQWPMGLACLTYELVGSNMWCLDENTRLSIKERRM